MAESDLEKLKKRLYKKEEEVSKKKGKERRGPLSRPQDIKTYWNKSPAVKRDLRETIDSMKKKRKFPLFLFFALALLLVLLVLLVGAGLYFFDGGILGGGNIISSRKIDIAIEGPAVIGSGEYSNWYISVSNNNESALEMADLIVNYPSGSLSSDGERLLTERYPIGRIANAGTGRVELGFFMVGEEDEQKEINFTLEYRLEDSNAIFAKKEKKIINLSRSAVGISLSAPKEVESGQKISLKIESVSNSEVVLKNVYLTMEYPPGFQFLDANLKPVEGQNTWLIGDLVPQGKYILEISGILKGQDLTALNFRANLAIKNDGELNILSFQAAPVLLKRPFVNFGILINNKKDTDVVPPDKRINVSIPWKNNLPTEIRDAVIKVKLSGKPVDFSTLSASEGYLVSDSSVIWNASIFPVLSSIAPGAAGEVTFSFSLKDVLPVETLEDKNFTFVLEGEMSGTRVGDGAQASMVKSTAVKTVKIASKIQLNSALLYSSGPFFNSGPLPPKVGQETTYTVVWSVFSFYNDINGAAVRASMPPYVSWLGQISPSDENIVYNQTTGELVWNVGLIKSGTGILRPAKEVSFRVAITPAVNQVGENLMVIDQARLEAKDTFTDLSLTESEDSLSIDAVPEAKTDFTKGRVVE